MNATVGAEEATDRYRDKSRDNQLRTSRLYGGASLAYGLLLETGRGKKRVDAAEKYALRVIPAETRLTVYRRLRVSLTLVGMHIYKYFSPLLYCIPCRLG